MQDAIRLISKVAERDAPSRLLSFNAIHVFKTLQMMQNGKTSRSQMMRELNLGEGSIKTLVKHLKHHGLVETSNSGMWLTTKGKIAYSKLCNIIPREVEISKCSIAFGRYNHAVILKNMAYGIRSGIEQRDIAIKSGAIGATTLIFKNNRLEIPGTGEDLKRNDKNAYSTLLKNLSPSDNDVIIIASSQSRRTAEFASKSIALSIIEKA